MAKIAEKGQPAAVAPDNAATVKALRERVETLQKSSGELRDVAGKIPRELNEAEKRVLVENAASISAAEADIAVLEKSPDATRDEQIKALQKRRVELAEQSLAFKNLERSRKLTDDERRAQYHNSTVIAEIDHQLEVLERERVASLPAAERVKVLQKERDALAEADVEARNHLNAPAIANLDTQIANAKAEAAAEGEKK